MTGISFKWTYIKGDSGGGTFNDGMDVSACDSAGNRLALLLKADGATPSTTGCTFTQGGGGGTQQVTPLGPKTFSGVFGAVPAGSYVGFAIWNAGDNTFAPTLVWDEVVFSAPNVLVGAGAAAPSTVIQGNSTLLTVALTATGPPNPPIGGAVTINLSSIGGSATQTMYDDGSNGDVLGGDNTFSFSYLVPGATPPATYPLPWSASDSAARTASGSISLTVIAPPPVNDNCAGAIPVFAGANGPYSNAAATESGVASTCAVPHKDIWFSYFNLCPGPITVTTCGSTLDTVLAAFPSCGGASLACNDDSCGAQSFITFAGAAATTYLIRAGSFSTVTTGSFPINITAPPPCVGISGTGTANPSTVVQGSSTLLTVAITAATPPIPPTGVAVTIDLSSIGGSATQTMYDDGSNGDVTPGDNVFSFNATVAGATPPAMYSLPWNAIDSLARTTNGAISVTVVPPPPSNDDCSNPIAIALGSNGPFTNASATDSGVIMTCGSGGYDDVWFSYSNNACAATLTVTTGCGGYDTILAAYGSCGGASLACNDDTPACGFGGSTITFAAAAMTTYLFQVAGYSPGSGTFSINITAQTASKSQIGPGCSDGGGPGPTLDIDAPPVICSNRVLSITGAAPAASGMLMFSFPGTPTGLSGGCPLYLNQGSITLLFFMGTDAFGNWAANITVPCDPNLECATFTVQGILFPTSPPPFYQVTSGLSVTLGY